MTFSQEMAEAAENTLDVEVIVRRYICAKRILYYLDI